MAVTFGGYCYDWVFDRDPENGSPRLRLEPATCTDTGIPTFGPGPAVVYATLDCCGEDYAIFSFGGEVLCPGTPPCPLTPPSQNVARYKIAWTPCAKWWCAYDADDETETCIPLYLTEDDICSGDYVTCSGPYDTYEDAIVDCPDAVVVLCHGHTIPSVLNVQVHALTCACIGDFTTTFTRNSVYPDFLTTPPGGIVTACAKMFYASLVCNPLAVGMIYSEDGAPVSNYCKTQSVINNFVPTTWSPFYAQFDITNDCCGGGNYRVTITE